MGLSGLFGTSTSKQSSSQTSSTSYPDWLQQALQGVGQSAASLGSTSSQYPQYSVAGLNSDENQAFDLTRNLVGQNQPMFNQAQSLYGQVANYGLNGPSQTQINSYMNPYINNVLDAQQQRDLQTYSQQKNALSAQQGAIGAFGGSRSAVAQGQLLNQFNQNEQYNQTNAYANAYNSALSGINSGMGLAATTAGGLASLGVNSQTSALQGIAALSGSGQQQQAQQQNVLNTNTQNGINSLMWPYQQLSAESGILNPLAGLFGTQNSSGTQTSTPGNSGFLGAALGGLSQLQGLGGVSGIGSLFGAGGGAGIGAATAGDAGLFGDVAAGSGGITAALSEAGPMLAFLQKGGVVPGKAVQGYAHGGVVRPIKVDVENPATQGRQFLKGLNYGYVPRQRKYYADGGEVTSDPIDYSPYNSQFYNDLSGGISNASGYVANQAGDLTDNLSGSMLGAAGGLNSAIDYFTQPSGFSDPATAQIQSMQDAVKQRQLQRQLSMASASLQDGQLPAGLQTQMNQVYALGNQGQDNAFIDPKTGKLMVIPNKNIAKNLPNSVASQVYGPDNSGPQDLTSQDTSPIGNGSGQTPTNTGTIFDQASNKGTDGYNLPLMAFGAALMGSNKGFFQALGDAGGAFVNEKNKQNATMFERQKYIQDLALKQQQAQTEQLRAQTYDKAINNTQSRFTDPYAVAKRQADTAYAQAKAQGGTPQQQVSSMTKALMASGLYTNIGQANADAVKTYQQNKSIEATGGSSAQNMGNSALPAPGSTFIPPDPRTHAASLNNDTMMNLLMQAKTQLRNPADIIALYNSQNPT